MPITEKSIVILNKTYDINFLNTSLHNTKIITLDFESHFLLLRKNIEHETSDKYIDEEQIIKIQEESYRLSSWYLENKINPILEYDGINIGELFYLEFYYKLLSVFWDLTNLRNIVKKYPDAKFIIPSKLESSIHLFTTSYELLEEKISNKDILDPEYEVPLNLFFIKIPVKLSKRKMQQINMIFEIFSKYILNNKIKYNKKTILIINLSTMRWKSLFLGLSDKFQLVKHDPVLPSMWNLKSFLILKKSKTIIENISNHFFLKTDNPINSDMLIIENKQKQIFENNEFFNNFFKFDNKSFWNVIENYFHSITKNKIYELIKYDKFLTNMFDKYNFSCIIVYNEIELPEIVSIKIAKKHKIPVVLLQHGINSFNHPIQQNFTRILGNYSDHFLVWGEYDKKFAITNNQYNTNIVNAGSLFYDDWLPHTPKNNEFYILIAPISPDDEEFAKFLPSNIKENYLKIIRKICQIIGKYNKKIIIKLHHDQYCFEDLAIDDLGIDVDVVRTGELKPMLENCELLITVGLTTAILEASILDKPSIFIPRTGDIQEENTFDEFSELVILPDQLDDFLYRFYHEYEFKKMILKSGKSFLNKNISNLGNSSKLFSQFINSLN